MLSRLLEVEVEVGDQVASGPLYRSLSLGAKDLLFSGHVN